MGRTKGSIIQIITTIDAEERARAIARRVVESRLAACAQVHGPISSVYRWKGTVEEATEWACVIKTVAANYGAVEQLIKANHTYEVAEILAVPVSEGNAAYLRWVEQNSRRDE